jgi:SNF2 family DNA or RNA helicase
MYVVNVLYPPMKSPFFDAIQTWHDLYARKCQYEHFSHVHRNRNNEAETAIINSMMSFPEVRLIEYDCGKLQTLAVMLRRLYSQGHRCLIFTQMSKM